VQDAVVVAMDLDPLKRPELVRGRHGHVEGW